MAEKVTKQLRCNFAAHTEPLLWKPISSPAQPTADGDSESPYPEAQPDDEGRAGMGVPRLPWPRRPRQVNTGKFGL